MFVAWSFIVLEQEGLRNETSSPPALSDFTEKEAKAQESK